MNATSNRLVEDYMRRLDRALKDVPRARRHELLQEIREHIGDASSELDDSADAEMRNVLERIGEPEQIAAEARERFGVRVVKPGAHEIFALILLLVGGVFLPVIGWFIGLILLWTSATWTARDKVIGTLLFPGGLAPFFFTLAFAVGPTCSSVSQSSLRASSGLTSPPLVEECTGGIGLLGPILGVVLLLAPIAGTVYLATRMRRRSVAAAAALEV